MKNFDNRAHKSKSNHNFYSQIYFYLILVWDNLYTLFDYFHEVTYLKFQIKVVQNEIEFLTVLHFFKHYKMINLDSITNENNKKHNENWPYIPDHPYRIIIIGGSVSEKTNVLINLINEQDDIDKIYLYARDLSEPK